MQPEKFKFFSLTFLHGIKKVIFTYNKRIPPHLSLLRSFLQTGRSKKCLKLLKNLRQQYLFPALGKLSIADIKTADPGKIMTQVRERVYEDLRVVLNSVFKYALANSLISNNPCS